MLSKLTSDLLDLSSVTAQTHPALVGLLELAAARPGFRPKAYSDKKRFTRQWFDVADAFRLALATNLSDAQLLNSRPFAGLRFHPPNRWSSSLSPLLIRPAVAQAILRAVGEIQCQRLEQTKA